MYCMLSASKSYSYSYVVFAGASGSRCARINTSWHRGSQSAYTAGIRLFLPNGNAFGSSEDVLGIASQGSFEISTSHGARPFD